MKTTVWPDGKMTYALSMAERVSTKVVTGPDGEQHVVPTFFGKLSTVAAWGMFAAALSAMILRAIGVLSAWLGHSGVVN